MGRRGRGKIKRTVSIGLIDFGILGKFAVRLEGTGFVGCIFQDNIPLLVLVVTER